jgi:RecJ-like exonuclease
VTVKLNQSCKICNGTGVVKVNEESAQVINGTEITYDRFGICECVKRMQGKAKKKEKPSWVDKYKKDR